MKKLAQEDNLKIVKTYTEAQSAKAPDIRDVFKEMIERIENDEADGILCWQINLYPVTQSIVAESAGYYRRTLSNQSRLMTENTCQETMSLFLALMQLLPTNSS